MNLKSTISIFILMIFLFSGVNRCLAEGNSYYQAEDLDSLWTSKCLYPTASTTAQDAIRNQITQSIQDIPYIRRLWDFYMETSAYDPACPTVTGNIFMNAERLLSGKSIEIDLSDRYSLTPRAAKPPLDSRLYIGLKKVSLNLKYDF